MCDCNNKCDDCNIRITSSSIRPLSYVQGVDEQGCKAWTAIGNLGGNSLQNVSVSSPLTGNGTSGSPVDINFALISQADLSAIASVIPSGTILSFLGKDSLGNIVSQQIFQVVSNSISGTSVNHPNDYFGNPTAYLGTPVRWVTLPDGGKVPVY